LALSGRAGTVTVQFVESAASACVWAKLNAAPAASTAFDPARPARPARLMGGMPATVAAVVAGADAAAEPDADGQGTGAAGLAAAAGALAPVAGALAAAAGALASAAGAAWLPLAAGAALAAAEAHEPRADCAIVVELPLETARMIPRVRPSAIGMARGTAMRAARLFRRRRHADPCPLSIQSTSMWQVPCHAPGASR
jgi:hypothetical protein